MIKAIALKYIGDNATGDHPGFTFAEKGQELLVIKEYVGWLDFDFVCQDLEKKYGELNVSKEEIEVVT